MTSDHTVLAPIHARQFLLGPRIYKAREDWVSLQIGENLVLTHCPWLRVRQITDKAGRFWVLLGFVVQCDPGRSSPEDELSACSLEDISPVHESWAGRWLLIGERELYLDAAGLLGCYYLNNKELWLSSSIALLSSIGGREVIGSRRNRFVKGDGIGWDPPPATCYEGIFKLLPTQSLDLASGHTLPRSPLPPPETITSYDELVARTSTCLTTTIRNIGSENKSVWLALSAGYHSRLLLAATLKAQINFTTYTQSFPLMLQADRELAPELAKSCGIVHHLRQPKADVRSLYQRMDEHSHGLYSDADRTFYGKQQWSWFSADDIAIRGLGLELGQCFDWPLLPSEPSLEPILTAFGADHAPRYVKDSMVDYLNWLSVHPASDMDWRDRWYLDMRLGGWVAEEEQALDILAGSSFVPANCGRLYRLLLQFPTETRQSMQHFIDMMDHIWPNLTDYPFNPPDSLTRRSARALHKYGSILRQRGPTTATYQVSAALKRLAHRVQARMPG